jgi:hypothetical protein
MQANKTADNQYLIPLMDGIIENIDIADGILLTTSEFVSQIPLCFESYTLSI